MGRLAVNVDAAYSVFHDICDLKKSKNEDFNYQRMRCLL